MKTRGQMCLKRHTPLIFAKKGLEPIFIQIPDKLFFKSFIFLLSLLKAFKNIIIKYIVFGVKGAPNIFGNHYKQKLVWCRWLFFTTNYAIVLLVMVKYIQSQQQLSWKPYLFELLLELTYCTIYFTI